MDVIDEGTDRLTDWGTFSSQSVSDRAAEMIRFDGIWRLSSAQEIDSRVKSVWAVSAQVEKKVSEVRQEAASPGQPLSDLKRKLLSEKEKVTPLRS
jgi:hypothetical protein